MIMEQIDKFFDKINGYYFAFLTVIVGFGGSMLAFFLYVMVDPSYSPLSNFVSDMSVGPNCSDIIFFLFMVIMPIVIIPFYLYLTRSLQKQGTNPNLTWIAFGTSVLSALSQILTAFFPLDANKKSAYDTHLIFGQLIFLFLGITMILFAYLENTQPSIPKYSPILASGAAVLSLLFALFLFLGTYTSVFDYNTITYLTEWSAFSVFILWLLLKGIYFYKNPSQ
ncbi:hypothetical protein CEE45_17895 [Candidatus Heimdallarchaeota archaeon B3_Heim]|nr:MAG: hypothetical protein CEE45_17895 [Candidatus Heimdallarchaeota archaeon B3_Heim]